MAKKTVWLSSFLVLVVLTYSIYVMIPGKVKLVVENTRTKIYVMEEGKWELGATEYVNLFDGTKKMRASQRNVSYLTQGNITSIFRRSLYKSNISTLETYTFNSALNDVEFVPVSHQIECFNCVGKIMHFEYRDLIYKGITRPATSPESFGRKINIEWGPGYYYAKLFQQLVTDKLIIRYRPASNHETYYVRMYDPIPTLTIEGLSKNMGLEVGDGITVNATTNVCLDFNHSAYGINYSCGANVTFDINMTYFRRSINNDSATSMNLTYTGPANHTFYIDAHQYDEVEGITINITGIEHGGTYPFNVKIFINNTLSNYISGLLLASASTVEQFNNSNTTQNNTFTGVTTETVGYFRVPKSANVTLANMTLKGYNLGYLNKLEYYVLIAADSVTCSAFQLHNVSCTEISAGIWKINRSIGIYELNRAKVMQSLWYTGDSSPLITGTTGVTALMTVDLNDIGYRGYWATARAQGTGGYSVSFNGTFYNASANTVSSWSEVYTGGLAGSADWSLPFGTVLNGVSGPNQAIKEYGLDKSADEALNPNAAKLASSGGGGGSSTATYTKGYFFAKGGVGFGTCLGTGSRTCTSYDFFTQGNIPVTGGTVPSVVYLEVGNLDGNYEFNTTGRFNTTNISRDFSTELNTYLAGCTADSDGYCNVPVTLYSQSAGIIEISDININYSFSWNPVTLSRNLTQAQVGNGTNSTTIKITIENTRNGTVNVSDIRYDYMGGNRTYLIQAHDVDYSANVSYNLTFFYSKWDYKLPRRIDYMEFLPKNPNEKNVVPYGQLSTRGFLNVTSYAYGSTYNFSVYLNETFGCVNLSVSNTSTKSKGIKMDTSIWYDVKEDQKYLSNFYLWFWADYNCSYNTWYLWEPELLFRACCIGCEVCSGET